MTEDLTPKQLKCEIAASCPSIHRLEDGRLLIVGTYASHCDGQASDLREQLGMANKIASHETAIVISPDLLDTLIEEKVKEFVSTTAATDKPLCDQPICEWQTMDSAPINADWRKAPVILAWHKRLKMALIVSWEKSSTEYGGLWLNRTGGGGYRNDDLSHWMPLPSPPTSGDRTMLPSDESVVETNA